MLIIKKLSTLFLLIPPNSLLLELRWKQVLSEDGYFTIREKKTGKRRTVKVNPSFRKHIEACYDALKIKNDGLPCFVSRKHTIYSIQRINVKFKYIKVKYGVRIGNFSTHTLCKTFGRRVFEQAGENAEMALVKLMEMFNHSLVCITKRYLGLREEEIMEAYDLLDF